MKNSPSSLFALDPRKFSRLAALLITQLGLVAAIPLAAADPATPKTGDDLEAADVGNTDLGKGTDAAKSDRLAWWRDARFGCFVHWGPSSQLANEWHGKRGPGYAEHIQRALKISMADYKKDAVDQFNPTRFDADKWIRRVKQTGMRYFIITAKHHDGFAMYDSDVSDYNIVKQGPWRRDPIRELKDACDREKIPFGVYYSHAFDWGDAFAPGNDWEWKNPGGDLQLGGGKWYDLDPEKLRSVRENYVDKKAIPQILELIRKYHPQILWFDTPQKLPDEENRRIMAAVRKADPNVIVSGRLVYGKGDYASTGDRAVEFRKLDTDWEAIPTTNESYGWNPLDNQYKTPGFLLRVLAKSVSRGGNMLMNVGPTRDGEMAPNDIKILDGMGDWMGRYGEAIHGCSASPLPPQAWGVITSKNTALYLHVFDWPARALVVGGLQTDPKSAFLLTPTGRVPITFKRINELDLALTLPGKPADAADSVVLLEFNEIPQGGGARLVDPHAPTNQLLAYDADLHAAAGKTGDKAGFGFGDGKMNNYTVTDWKRTDQWMSWDLRVTEPAEFEVSLAFGKCKGGSYELRCGDWKATGTAPVTAGSIPRIAAVQVDALGTLPLQPGNHHIELRVTRANDGEVFRPLELRLTPKN